MKEALKRIANCLVGIDHDDLTHAEKKILGILAAENIVNKILDEEEIRYELVKD
jgi:DNA-binding CsgD family transcriptional regulator